MTDVREKLGRLNCTTVKFDTGSGGTPEFTNQDIAAALAFVQPGLGREVLESAWWPGGAGIRPHGLRNAVTGLVAPMLTAQIKRVSEASLDLQLAEAAILWADRAVPAAAREEVARCRARLADARAACWPQNTMEKLPYIAKSIIVELRGVRCPACSGTGVVHKRTGNEPCPSCGGSGDAKVLDSWRAKTIKVDSSDYPKRWRRVYSWLHDKMRDAEADAARQFEGALRRAAA